jgi:Trypsin-like peptidase domain
LHPLEGNGGHGAGDWFIETIRTSDGKQHKVSPCAVEPMTDIAVLEAVDGQEMSEECHAFEEFCEDTEPVPVSEDDFPNASGCEQPRAQVGPDGRITIPKLEAFTEPPPIPVHVLTHKGTWVTGNAQRFGSLNSPPAGSVWVKFSTQIEGGTSGSPVIDDNGLLVGVISHSSDNPKGRVCDGLIPRPHLALPVWVWSYIKFAATEGA